MGNNKNNNYDIDEFCNILGITQNKLKSDSSLSESVPPYRLIEGIYIQDSWINHKDYPEPPDEIEEPTEDSKKTYDRYRRELEIFSLRMIKE